MTNQTHSFKLTTGNESGMCSSSGRSPSEGSSGTTFYLKRPGQGRPYCFLLNPDNAVYVLFGYGGQYVVWDIANAAPATIEGVSFPASWSEIYSWVISKTYVSPVSLFSTQTVETSFNNNQYVDGKNGTTYYDDSGLTPCPTGSGYSGVQHIYADTHILGEYPNVFGTSVYERLIDFDQYNTQTCTYWSSYTESAQAYTTQSLEQTRFGGRVWTALNGSGDQISSFYEWHSLSSGSTDVLIIDDWTGVDHWYGTDSQARSWEITSGVFGVTENISWSDSGQCTGYECSVSLSQDTTAAWKFDETLTGIYSLNPSALVFLGRRYNNVQQKYEVIAGCSLDGTQNPSEVDPDSTLTALLQQICDTFNYVSILYFMKD